MTGIQLIVIAFAIVMLFLSYSSFRRRNLAAGELATWSLIWFALIGVSLFPDRLRALVGPLQIARLLDLVMIGGLMLLAVLVFLLNQAVRRLQERLTELVRSLALAESFGDRRDLTNQEQQD